MKPETITPETPDFTPLVRSVQAKITSLGNTREIGPAAMIPVIQDLVFFRGQLARENYENWSQHKMAKFTELHTPLIRLKEMGTPVYSYSYHDDYTGFVPANLGQVNRGLEDIVKALEDDRIYSIIASGVYAHEYLYNAVCYRKDDAGKIFIAAKEYFVTVGVRATAEQALHTLKKFWILGSVHVIGYRSNLVGTGANSFPALMSNSENRDLTKIAKKSAFYPELPPFTRDEYYAIDDRIYKDFCKTLNLQQYFEAAENLDNQLKKSSWTIRNKRDLTELFRLLRIGASNGELYPQGLPNFKNFAEFTWQHEHSHSRFFAKYGVNTSLHVVNFLDGIITVVMPDYVKLKQLLTSPADFLEFNGHCELAPHLEGLGYHKETEQGQEKLALAKALRKSHGDSLKIYKKSIFGR